MSIKGQSRKGEGKGEEVTERPRAADTLLNEPQESLSHVLEHSGKLPKKPYGQRLLLRTKGAAFPMYSAGQRNEAQINGKENMRRQQRASGPEAGNPPQQGRERRASPLRAPRGRAWAPDTKERRPVSGTHHTRGG